MPEITEYSLKRFEAIEQAARRIVTRASPAFGMEGMDGILMRELIHALYGFRREESNANPL